MSRYVARRRAVCLFAPLFVVLTMLSGVVSPAARAVVTRETRVAGTGPDRLANPAQVLPAGWKTSPDRAVAVAGDATGLHVLVASAASGYAWRTLATLGVRGTDTTQWIGQACLTGGGNEAVIVYAPRQITNAPDALGYGALGAVVNLTTGKVTQLGAGVSIAYFDPGCGTGQDAVLTQGGTGASPLPGPASTRLMLLDTVTGKITSTVSVPGQLTSAVPFDGQIAGVDSAGVVSIGPAGKERLLAKVHGQAFRLTPDARGGLGYQVASGRTVEISRWTAGEDERIGSASLGSVELSQVGGTVYVTGEHASALGRMPADWRALNVTAGADMSSTGMLAVSLASTDTYPKGTSPVALVPGEARPVSITGQIASTAKPVSFTAPAASPQTPGMVTIPAALPGYPGAGTGVKTSRGTGAVSPPPSTNPATTTYDPDRSCSVPRNDPSIQTYQPSAQQVEWAVDEAVQGDLTGTQSANLYGSGLPAYSPQGLFPAPGLDGGGSVPAQVLLGVLAQESNEDQASSHAIIGQTGNFELSSNWYGDGGNYTSVDWAASDCGYGIGQVTSGMCLSSYATCTSPLPYEDQLAIAVDYEANIAASLQILEQKWNELDDLPTPILANGGSPQYISNWWFALWAYNSGMEPNGENGNTTGCAPGPSCTDSNGDWGLGWVDNPANPLYPPDRPMFLATGPSGSVYTYNWDEAHPAGWSYEEKVMGFATYGLVGYNYVKEVYGQDFELAYYPDSGGGTNPQLSMPFPSQFCSTATATDDNCNPSDAGTSSACQLSNDHCWWHWPTFWTQSCSLYCGTQVLAYSAGAANPGDPGVPSGYAPQCSSSPLPSNAVIVGDTASSIPAPLGCGTSWSNNGGTMTWNFGAASTSPATYPSKIDFHQIGGGYSGHFWFTHTIPSSSTSPGGQQPPQAGNADLRVTGTWTPPSSVMGWTRIEVAIPDEGAWDPQASYQVNLGNGTTEYRVVNQAYQTNTWVSLGFFDLSSGANVSLSNVTFNGLGFDIAWDAMAFIPATAPTADYVALGDSYSAGEGLSPYVSNADYNYAGMQNSCHRSASQSYPQLVKLPGQSTSIAAQAASPSNDVQFAYTACSGVTTPDITENAVDQCPGLAQPYITWCGWDAKGDTSWTSQSEGSGGPAVFNALTQAYSSSTSKEIPQADQGWLSPTTTLVTISIGGNDARFSAVISGCVETDSVVSTDGNGCSGSNYYLTNNGVVDPAPLYEFEPEVIDALPWHLEQVYATIAELAPNAHIIVLGYPRIFPGDTDPASACAVDAASVITIPDETMLNEFGDDVNAEIKDAVTTEQSAGVDIDFIDPAPAFTGHEVCSSDPWINGVVNEEYSNAGDSIPGVNSFHPLAAGQQEEATLVDECIAGTLPASEGTC